jgi:hypothetical protein
MLLMHPEMQFGGIAFSLFCPRATFHTAWTQNGFRAQDPYCYGEETWSLLKSFVSGSKSAQITDPDGRSRFEQYATSVTKPKFGVSSDALLNGRTSCKKRRFLPLEICSLSG